MHMCNIEIYACPVWFTGIYPQFYMFQTLTSTQTMCFWNYFKIVTIFLTN